MWEEERMQAVFEALSVIEKLVDSYEKYGFLYDESGEIKMKYWCPYTSFEPDGEEGPLCDSEGHIMTEDPFEDWENQQYEYLAVHNPDVFKNITVQMLFSMDEKELMNKYFKWMLPKLLAMLRRGYHYAGQNPVNASLCDDELSAMLLYTWRRAVVDTLQKYEGVERTVIVKPFRFDADYFKSEEFKAECRRFREERKQKEADLLQVIRASFSDVEWNNLPSVRFMKAVEKAYQTESEESPNKEAEEEEKLIVEQFLKQANKNDNT